MCHYASIKHARSFSGGEAGERVCPRGENGVEMTEGTRFMTVAEVADQIRVSKMTVYRLVHSGELEAVRVGRSFRVPEHAVEELLNKSFYQAG